MYPNQLASQNDIWRIRGYKSHEFPRMIKQYKLLITGVETDP